MKNLLFIFALTFAIQGHSQDTIVNFLNRNGKVLKQEDATVIQMIVKKDTTFLESLFSVKTRKLLSIGYYSDEAITKKVGQFQFYDKEGVLEIIANYNKEGKYHGKYLSFSQLVLWDKSPEEYRKKYYPDVRPEFWSNIRMAFGNFVTEAMERNELWVEFIPRYPVFEREELVDFGDDEFCIPIKLFIDNMRTDINKFKEQKTGETVWTQNMVDKHKQLDIYSTALQIKDGFVYEECELVDVRTRIVDLPKPEKQPMLRKKQPTQKVELTGYYQVFRRRITQEERDECKRWVLEKAKEISEDYQAIGHLY